IAIATQRASEWGLPERASFVTSDFCETRLDSSIADAVFSIDALPAAQDVEGALLEVHRLLKPGGSFVFTARELAPTGRHFEKMGADWNEGLERTGFHIVSSLHRPN